MDNPSRILTTTGAFAVLCMFDHAYGYRNVSFALLNTGAWPIFGERHAKEVLDLFRRSQAESLVKADRAFEGRRRVEGNSLAISFAEMRFRPHQQLCRNPAALLSGNNGHSPDVAFCRVDDSASDRSDDFTGFLVCYKYGHPLKAIRNRVPREDRVGERTGRVAVAIFLECSG